MVWLPPIDTGERTLCADRTANGSSFWQSVAQKDYAEVYLNPSYKKTPRLSNLGSNPANFTYEYSPRSKATNWDWHMERPVRERPPHSKPAGRQNVMPVHLTPRDHVQLSQREREAEKLAELSHREKASLDRLSELHRREKELDDLAEEVRKLKEAREQAEISTNKKNYNYVRDYANPRDYDNYRADMKRGGGEEVNVMKTSYSDNPPATNTHRETYNDRHSDGHYNNDRHYQRDYHDDRYGHNYYPSSGDDYHRRPHPDHGREQYTRDDHRQYDHAHQANRDGTREEDPRHHQMNGYYQERNGLADNHTTHVDHQYVDRSHEQGHTDSHRPGEEVYRETDDTHSTRDESIQAGPTYRRPRSDRYLSETMSKFRFGNLSQDKPQLSSRQAALGIVPANEFFDVEEVEPVERLLPNCDRDQTFKMSTDYPASCNTRKKKFSDTGKFNDHIIADPTPHDYTIRERIFVSRKKHINGPSDQLTVPAFDGAAPPTPRTDFKRRKLYGDHPSKHSEIEIA